MNRIITIVLCILFSTAYFGQTREDAPQNLELTKKNIKSLFKQKPDSCCVDQAPKWIACYDTDSTYRVADTVNLYSDQYYYLISHCCFITSWTFTGSTTFSLSETNVCQEPPRSSSRDGDYGLRIKFRKEGSGLVMSIYKGRKVKDIFRLLSLDYVELRADQFAYRLTMVRIVKTRSN